MQTHTIYSDLTISTHYILVKYMVEILISLGEFGGGENNRNSTY